MELAKPNTPRLPADPLFAGLNTRGRPRLGVIAREVTLLPHHWRWLNAQAGGASAALRALVEARCGADPDDAVGDDRVGDWGDDRGDDRGGGSPWSHHDACVAIATAAGVAAIDAGALIDGGSDSAGPAERFRSLVDSVKALHGAPLFPTAVRYFDRVTVLIEQLRGTDVLPALLLRRLAAAHEESSAHYPRWRSDLVSSHGDLNPTRVVFDGGRTRLTAWQCAGADDRFVDLAAIANFFTADPDEEDYLLQLYFGSAWDPIRRARLFVMQQANRLGNGLSLLTAVLAQRPGTVVTVPQLRTVREETPSFQCVRDDLQMFRTIEGRLRLACILLNEALFYFDQPRYQLSLLCLWNLQDSPA